MIELLVEISKDDSACIEALRKCSNVMWVVQSSKPTRLASGYVDNVVDDLQVRAGGSLAQAGLS